MSVNALKPGRKADEALHETNNKVHNPYVQAQEALINHINGLQQLDNTSSGVSTASTATDVLEPLVTEAISSQHELSHLETSPGRDPKEGFSFRAIRKLQFALDEDRTVRESYDRTRSSVDAALYQALKYGLSAQSLITSDHT